MCNKFSVNAQAQPNIPGLFDHSPCQFLCLEVRGYKKIKRGVFLVEVRMEGA